MDTDKWRFLQIAVLGREKCPTYPDQIAQPEKYFEGVALIIVVNRFERSPRARESCIAHYGPICQVCSMDFSSIYGSIGDGFIHVHHLKPLGAIGNEYVVDPINDLRPVCPNCHAMIHRRARPFAISELKAMLAKLK